MSKVHINNEGVNSIPSNCFPILVSIGVKGSGSGHWGWATAHYSVSKKNAVLCEGGRDTNDNVSYSGGSESAYVPFNCDSYEDLLKGSFSSKGNMNNSISRLKYFIWAEK